MNEATTPDRPEDIANRRLYNHLPTKKVRVVIECAANAGDPLAFAETAFLGNVHVRNVQVISTELLSDEVTYLDDFGRETTP